MGRLTGASPPLSKRTVMPLVELIHLCTNLGRQKLPPSYIKKLRPRVGEHLPKVAQQPGKGQSQDARLSSVGPEPGPSLPGSTASLDTRKSELSLSITLLHIRHHHWFTYECCTDLI